MTKHRKIQIIKKMIEVFLKKKYTFLCPTYRTAAQLCGMRPPYDEGALVDLGLIMPKNTVTRDIGGIKIHYWWNPRNRAIRLRALRSALKRLSK